MEYEVLIQMNIQRSMDLKHSNKSKLVHMCAINPLIANREKLLISHNYVAQTTILFLSVQTIFFICVENDHALEDFDHCSELLFILFIYSAILVLFKKLTIVL